MGITFSLILVAITVLFAFTSVIEPEDMPLFSTITTGVNTSDFQSQEFRDSLNLKDVDGENLDSPVGNSFVVSVLDFVQDIPIIGNVVSFFILIYSILFEGPVAIVNVLQRIGSPPAIFVTFGLLFRAIYLITLFSFIKDFMAARSGGST